MAERLVTDPAKKIREYDVYETDEGFRAVHKTDPDLVFANADWYRVFADAWAARIARSYRWAR